MYNGMYHTEWIHEGRKILIDLAMFPDGSAFEVAVLDRCTFDEYEIEEFAQLGDAIDFYNEMLAKYPEDKAPEVLPLFGKYAKLRDDLRAAWEKTPNSTDDGGTCNMDCPVLNLPHWQRSKVEQAGREAGLKVFYCGPGRYQIGLASAGQADARTAKAEAMRDYLTTAGYNAHVWYYID